MEFKELKSRYWGQHLWSVGYFCRSVGTITEKTIKDYIENQENEVVDLEMFVEVFKKIGDNLNCIAGYYEEMATFVPDYD